MLKVLATLTHNPSVVGSQLLRAVLLKPSSSWTAAQDIIMATKEFKHGLCDCCAYGVGGFCCTCCCFCFVAGESCGRLKSVWRTTAAGAE